jgi:signal transduction histidine kinase
MDRRMLLKVTAPAVLVGLLLLGACLASVWSINRLQAGLVEVQGSNVAGLQAAQELVITLRQLRLHSLLYVIEPTPSRHALMEADHQSFEEALTLARSAMTGAPERRLLDEIETGYKHYRADLDRPDALPDRRSVTELLRWADAHPVRSLVVPCHELLKLTRDEMQRVVRESEEVSERTRTAMLLLGVAGPLGGLLGGYGIARGLSRSIARLNVWVRDVQAHMDRPAGALVVAPDADGERLDSHLQQVVDRIRELVDRLQQQKHAMQRAEQLAAVGRLAASVAHEIRNPLTSIKMLIGVALRGGALTADDLGVIYGEIARLERTVQGLLDFARLPQPNRRLCDLNESATRAVELVRARAAQQQVAITVSPSQRPALVLADAGQLGTVLVNLLLNALDATPSGGRIAVEVGHAPDGAVQATVRDTGPGVPAEIADRLFEPFATTKPTGTGLGLNISRRVAEAHGGRLEAANGSEGGACFTLTLPAAPENAYNGDPVSR